MGCCHSVAKEQPKGLSSSSSSTPSKSLPNRQSPSVNPGAQQQGDGTTGGGGGVVPPSPPNSYNNKVMPWKKKRVFFPPADESCQSHQSTTSLTTGGDSSSSGRARVNSNSLSDWKNELALDGKLSSAAVRIEVSSNEKQKVMQQVKI
jgi:hypothetical protein